MNGVLRAWMRCGRSLFCCSDRRREGLLVFSNKEAVLDPPRAKTLVSLIPALIALVVNDSLLDRIDGSVVFSKLLWNMLMLVLHKFRVTEEHKKYSVDATEPMVLFALSSGMFSSPAIRIFSAENVRGDLQESMRDYIRASVGINNKGKLTVPALQQSYAKGTVEDSLLADWICRQLTPAQVAAIQNTTSSRKQRLLGFRSFTVIPFDSKFRYLFLPDRTDNR